MLCETKTQHKHFDLAATGDQVAIGLGSNLGDCRAHLRWAIARLTVFCGPLRIAPLYRSAPLSALAQPDFLNSVVLAMRSHGPLMTCTPAQLLAHCKALEFQAGRRPGPRHGPRPLDLDLLFWGTLCQADPALTLPHPELRRRRFVLAPLADLVPDLALPPDGMRVSAALAALSPGQEVERLSWDT